MLVLGGAVEVADCAGSTHATLPGNHYAYAPPAALAAQGEAGTCPAAGCACAGPFARATEASQLLVFEREYSLSPSGPQPAFQHGCAEDSPLLDTGAPGLLWPGSRASALCVAS